MGRSIATGIRRKPVGGCDSAEMRRPAIRTTAHACTNSTSCSVCFPRISHDFAKLSNW